MTKPGSFRQADVTRLASNCRRCVDCEGMDHHWMYVGDEDDAGEPVMSCKHCEARRPIEDDDE